MTGSYVSEVAADSPLIYLRLNDASGTTAFDSSGNFRNGTYFGTPGYSTAGLLPGEMRDKAITFSSDDYIDVPYAAYMNQTQFTVEAIINPTTISGIKTIMCRYGGGFSASAFSFRIDTNKLHLYMFSGNSSPTISSTATLVAGTTYHVAVTYDGTNARLYINGVLDKTTALPAPNITSTRQFRVGRNGDGNEQFVGIMDEIAYYGMALSATRIAEHSAARSILYADFITFGETPVSEVTSSESTITGTVVTGSSPLTSSSSNFSYSISDFEKYPGDDPTIRLPFDFAGIMTPQFPPPSPPTDFSGLTNPTIAPMVTISTTVDGTLLPGTYRYSYAAWKGSPAQATAPSPSVEIILTTENTVSVTPVSISGADGYLIYREDL